MAFTEQYDVVVVGAGNAGLMLCQLAKCSEIAWGFKSIERPQRHNQGELDGLPGNSSSPETFYRSCHAVCGMTT
jgi:hypothetical protein